MPNNIFQSPFGITSNAINAALAGSTLLVGDGSASLPGYAFAGEPGTGIWRRASNLLSISLTGTHRFEFASTQFRLGSGGSINWSSTSTPGALGDLTILRDAADISAQQRGTNAQTTRLYNTFTDASNYERANLGWTSNVFEISTAAAGTGSSRIMRLVGAGTTLDITNNDVEIYRNNSSTQTVLSVMSTGLTSTSLLHTRLMPSINQASGTYTILDINPTETAIGAGPHYLVRGRIGAGGDVFNVDRTGLVYAGNGLTVANGTFTLGANIMNLTERADPGAPAPNTATLFCRDNGGGKTQLVARFNTGAVQVIATEP